MRVDYKPVDIDIEAHGNRLVGTDVFSDGSRSTLRQNLGTYESPEHALIMGEIISNPLYLVHAASGRFTQEKIDQAAAELRTRRIPGSNTTKPGGTEQWEYAPYASGESPSET